MKKIDLKYEYYIDQMIEEVLDEGIVQTLKGWFDSIWSKIKSIVSTELKIINQAWFGDEGEFLIEVDIPDEILGEVDWTKDKISSTSKIKGTLFEVETILALKEQVKGLKTKITTKDRDVLEKQLHDSIGKTAGTVIKQVRRGARISSKLILNPITEEGGTITEVDATGVEGQKSRGKDKLDLLVKWKKVGVSKKVLDKISLKLYSSKTVTLSNKAIGTFFEDYFEKKYADQIEKMIDKDKELLSLQAEEKALNKKVNQLKKKFKKSKRKDDTSEARKQIRAKIHPRIMTIVFGYVQKLLKTPATRNLFIKNFLVYTGLGDTETRIVFVLNKKKGRMEGMITPPDFDLSKLKLVYGGGSTFQIKNAKNDKTIANFGIKIGGGKINIDVPFTSGKFKTF